MKSDSSACLNTCTSDTKAYTDETDSNNFKCTLCSSAITNCDTCSSATVCTKCD